MGHDAYAQIIVLTMPGHGKTGPERDFVTYGTTIEALAEQSPIKKYPQQQLRLFNKLYPDGEPKPGDLVKTVR